MEASFFLPMRLIWLTEGKSELHNALLQSDFSEEPVSEWFIVISIRFR